MNNLVMPEKKSVFKHVCGVEFTEKRFSIDHIEKEVGITIVTDDNTKIEIVLDYDVLKSYFDVKDRSLDFLSFIKSKGFSTKQHPEKKLPEGVEYT